MSDVTTNVSAGLVGPGEGDAYWFLGALATIKASAESTGGSVAVIEHLAPPNGKWNIVAHGKTATSQ